MPRTFSNFTERCKYGKFTAYSEAPGPQCNVWEYIMQSRALLKQQEELDEEHVSLKCLNLDWNIVPSPSQDFSFFHVPEPCISQSKEE